MNNLQLFQNIFEIFANSTGHWTDVGIRLKSVQRTMQFVAKKPNRTDYVRIKKNIVKKLYAYGAFTHGHLLLERLQNGIPSHLVGFVKEVLADLVK